MAHLNNPRGLEHWFSFKKTACFKTPGHHNLWVTFHVSWEFSGHGYQPIICCLTRTWVLLLPLTVCLCVSVWLLSFIWKQLTPLSCSAGHNPNQTKAFFLSLYVSPSPTTPIKTVPPFNLSSPSSFVTISIILFFFHFPLLSYHSSPFFKAI